MMMGIAQPLKWSEEDFFASAFLCPPDNLAEQDAISMQRHVVPVLFVLFTIVRTHSAGSSIQPISAIPNIIAPSKIKIW